MQKIKYLYIISILLLTSCITQKKRAQICESCPTSTDIKETVKITPKKDTVIITKQGETIILESPCSELCDNLGNIKRFSRKRRKNGLVTTIRTENNTLIADCSADSLQAIIDTFEKETIRTEIITQEIVEVPLSWLDRMKVKFQGFLFWWFVISVLLIGGKLAAKGLKL